MGIKKEEEEGGPKREPGGCECRDESVDKSISWDRGIWGGMSKMDEDKEGTDAIEGITGDEKDVPELIEEREGGLFDLERVNRVHLSTDKFCESIVIFAYFLGRPIGPFDLFNFPERGREVEGEEEGGKAG